MLWSKAKSILIMAFLCINIFLIIILASQCVSEKRQQLFVKNETVEVLKKRGVALPEHLPENISAGTTAVFKSAFFNTGELGELFLGKSSVPVSVNNGIMFKDTISKGTVGLDDKGFFKYEMPYDEKNSEKTTETAADEIAREFMSGKTDFSNARLTGALETENGWMLEYTNTYREHLIFGNSIKITVNKSVTNISGIWYIEDKNSKSNSYSLKSPEHILLGFLSNPERKSNVKITEMYQGYSMSVKADGNAYLNCIWCLKDDTGRVYNYDARTGEFLSDS